MLNHFVFIKYVNGTGDDHIAAFTRGMLALRNTIPEIAQLTIGRDMLHEARSWDLLLCMTFASVDALRQYQRHADHQAMMAFNQPRVAEVGSVDFFVSDS